jgi:hypothetical protein
LASGWKRSIGDGSEQARELIRFLKEFAMGDYYSKAVAAFFHGEWLNERDLSWEQLTVEEEAREKVKMAALRKRYALHIIEHMNSIEELVVEMLRYQDWVPPARMRSVEPILPQRSDSER